MVVYEGVDLSGQTIQLEEQTQFIGCEVDDMRIIDNGFGWELLGCFGSIADER